MADPDVSPKAADRLIASSTVSGTSVFNPRGEKLGTLEDVMIDKPSGRIAYAVLGFGGIFGIGGHRHPLPWSTLRYDTALGGYIVDLDPSVLEGAPAYAAGDDVAWEDEAWGRRIHDYYGAEPYWCAFP